MAGGIRKPSLATLFARVRRPMTGVGVSLPAEIFATATASPGTVFASDGSTRVHAVACRQGIAVIAMPGTQVGRGRGRDFA